VLSSAPRIGNATRAEHVFALADPDFCEGTVFHFEGWLAWP